VHSINIKRPEFGIFSHLYWYLLKDEEKCRGFFRMTIEQFYRLSQLVAEEIRKQNTNYRRAIKPEVRFAIIFKYVLSVGDKKGILDIIGATLFLN
jgi:hypothetical protein